MSESAVVEATARALVVAPTGNPPVATLSLHHPHVNSPSPPQKQTTPAAPAQNDFVGAADAIKALFSMPFAQEPSVKAECIALHRLGNTLYFEDASAIRDIASAALAQQPRPTTPSQSTLQGAPNAAETEADAVAVLLDALDGNLDRANDTLVAANWQHGLPPAKWVPPPPRPPLHTYHWKFNDFRIVAGSDLEVWSGEGHPGVSTRVHPEGSSWAPCTALDAYLDNVMAAIPELALCLESKGFVTSAKLMETRAIPRVDVSTPGPGLAFLAEPLFDPKDVELNAGTLLRFLQANCATDGATYLLQREPMPDIEDAGEGAKAADCVRLYDLSAMGATSSRKWKWLLAMLSYRFANRLSHFHGKLAGKDEGKGERESGREERVGRQRELLETCLSLLTELAEMGGHAHDFLRATVHTQLADSFLSQAPEQQRRPAPASAPMTPPSLPFVVSQPREEAEAPPPAAHRCSALESALSGVSVACLEAAQSHLTRGLKVLDAVCQPKVRPDARADAKPEGPVSHATGRDGDDSTDGSGDDADDADDANEGGGGDEDNMYHSVRLEARRLRLKSVHVVLALAARHLAAFRASNAMSLLREAAYKLQPLLGARRHAHAGAGLHEGPCEGEEGLQWLWELGARFCRAVGCDRFGWVDRAGVLPSDVLTFLHEVDGVLGNAVLRRDAAALSSPGLCGVAFIDPAAWQFVSPDEAEALPLAKTAPPPVRRPAEQAAPDADRRTEKRGKGKARAPATRREKTGDSGPETTGATQPGAQASGAQATEAPPQPTPLLIGCALCASRALEAVAASGAEALLRSRLGDACNEVGQALLRTVPHAPHAPLGDSGADSHRTQWSESAAEDRRLFCAMLWFGRGLLQFKANDDRSNTALLLCNLASAKKLAAGRLPRTGTAPLWRSADATAVPVMELVEVLLSEAIGDCYGAMEALGDRACDSRTWEHISRELALAYLTLGVRRRQALLGGLKGPGHEALQTVPPGAARRVAEPLEQAASIYEALGDGAQLAATRYQAGTLWSKLWTRAGDPKRSRERLGLALGHYEAAHAFFKGQAGSAGRTLIMIDLDLFDLYIGVHSASSGNAECLRKGLLCLLETHVAFAAQAPAGATAAGVTAGGVPASVVPASALLARGDAKGDVAELLRLAALVGERLPRVLLLLAKEAAKEAARGRMLAALGQSVGALPAACEADSEGFKALYRLALTFAWPDLPKAGSDAQPGSFDLEGARGALAAVGAFLRDDVSRGVRGVQSLWAKAPESRGGGMRDVKGEAKGGAKGDTKGPV